jgi:hypothetical protein
MTPVINVLVATSFSLIGFGLRVEVFGGPGMRVADAPSSDTSVDSMILRMAGLRFVFVPRFGQLAADI